MSDIFISYSSADRERILPIVTLLEQQGWSVWWDRKIPPGRTFDDVIEEAINAAKCIIVVWSEKSVASNWVRAEADEGNRKGVLIPIMIDKVNLPLAFRRIEAAQLVNWDGALDNPEVDILLSSIVRIVGYQPDINQEQSIEKKVDLELFPDSRIKSPPKQLASLLKTKNVNREPSESSNNKIRLSGTWKLTDKYEFGKTTGTLQLVQNGQTLSGTMTIYDILEDGKEIIFQEEVQGWIQGENISLSGTSIIGIKGDVSNYNLDKWVGVLKNNNLITGSSEDKVGTSGTFTLKRITHK